MFLALAISSTLAVCGILSVSSPEDKSLLESSPILLAHAPKLPERFRKKGIGAFVLDDSRNILAQYVDGKLMLACRVATAAKEHHQLRGIRQIRRPARWRPTWKPTPGVRAEYARKHLGRLPDRIPYGDPRNPLGIVCLDLMGESYIKIHATIPGNIGKDCTRGCFALLPGDARQAMENWRKAKRLYLYVYD